MKKLLLIDGHNLLFKMFFGMPFPFYNDTEQDITGTVGFVGTVVKIIKYLKADDCLVVFDGENSKTIRPAPEYKANRQADYSSLSDNENPFTQLKYIKAVLTELNIKWVETDTIECDDYISIIAEKYSGEVYISSTDTDFYQLVNNKIKIIRYRGKQTVIIDTDYITNKFGILPTDYALFKALTGDKADNIKGIYKVGAVTAKHIINSIKHNYLDKYSAIYNNNLPIIKSNLSLIELPNKNINKANYQLGNYNIDSSNFKNFKVLELIKRVTSNL